MSEHESTVGRVEQLKRRAKEFLAMYAGACVVTAVVMFSGASSIINSLPGIYSVVLASDTMQGFILSMLIAPIFFVPPAMLAAVVYRSKFEIRGWDVSPIAAWLLSTIGVSVFLYTVVAILHTEDTSRVTASLIERGDYISYVLEISLEIGLPAALSVIGVYAGAMFLRMRAKGETIA